MSRQPKAAGENRGPEQEAKLVGGHSVSRAQPAGPRTARRLPLLPLRWMVVFPHQVVPLFVGRARSLAAIQAALAGDALVLLVAQRCSSVAQPGAADVHAVGTVASIVQSLWLPDRTLRVIMSGRLRAVVRWWVACEPYVVVEVEEVPAARRHDDRIESLRNAVRSVIEQRARDDRRRSSDVISMAGAIDDPSELADVIAAHLPTASVQDRQRLLEIFDLSRRLDRVLDLLRAEAEQGWRQPAPDRGTGTDRSAGQ